MIYDLYACVATSVGAMAHAWVDTAVVYRTNARESSSPTLIGRESQHFDHPPSPAAPDSSRKLHDSLAVVTDPLMDGTA